MEDNNKYSKAPDKNTSQWKKNEKIINNSPTLKRARDRKEGIEKPATHYGQTHGGKGSATRTDTHTKEWQDAHDRIRS